MSSTRRAALAAGILFILADVAGVASVALAGSLLDGSGFAAGVAANSDRVAGAALLEALMGLACAGIAFALYPVLRQSNPALAIGAVGLRVAECVVFLVAAIAVLALVTVCRDAADAGNEGAVGTAGLASLLRAVHDQSGTVAALPFGAAAVLYYWVFWSSRLTPRWLSGWGLVAIALYLAVALWAVLSRTDFNDYSALLMPFALQEVVLAVWLIARGFSPAQPSVAAVSLSPAVAR